MVVLTFEIPSFQNKQRIIELCHFFFILVNLKVKQAKESDV